MVLAAVGQFRAVPTIGENVAACVQIIAGAAAQGAKAVFLPEASDFIAAATDVPKLSEPLASSSFLTPLRAAAQDANVFVSVGVHEAGATDNRCWNTHVIIGADGEVKSSYRKLHLFDVDIKGGLKILESNTTEPGKEIIEPTRSPIGAIGSLTCYDLRFPEPSLILRRKGADIITYPSAFTVKTGAAHWQTLLRARAIETQTYVIAAAQIGQHTPTRVSYGHSLIVSPWGDVLAQTPSTTDKPVWALADIDLDQLARVRREMPLWDQRRKEVYGTVGRE